MRGTGTIYGMNFYVPNRRGRPFRAALGSFVEEYNNTVEIVELNEETQEFESVPEGTFKHPYPTTKICGRRRACPQDLS